MGVLDSISPDAERLPKEYVAIPVTESQAEAPLRICALVRREPDPVAGHLVQRGLLDCRAVLGCIMDAGDRVRQWVEIWVQDVEAFTDAVQSSSVGRESLSNAALDERFRKQFEFLAAAGPEAVVQTGWEAQNPPPTLLDLDSLQPHHPRGGPGKAGWVLCKDDALLTAHGLQPYSTSLARYLYQPERGGDTQFLIVAGAAPPQNPHVVQIDDVVPRDQRMVPLNLTAGLMLVRACSPVGLSDLIEVIGGSAWGGVMHGRSRLRIGAVPADGEDAESLGGWLFLGLHGQVGRFAEAFHLKLRLIAGLVECVQALTRQTQRPLLNLRPESFEIACDSVGRGLPVLWSCRPRLVDPGNAISLKVPSGEMKYYLPGRDTGLSVYQPSVVAQKSHGPGVLYITRVQSPVGGQVQVEGTFTTQEYLHAQKNDLLWIRVHLAGERVDLYSKLGPQQSLAEGELRFVTVPQRFDDRVVAGLKSAEGVSMPQSQFEIIPLLSSPCDLYSLAVLAISTLLLRPKTTLPETVKAVLSLSRQLRRTHDPAVPLRMRIQSVVDSNKDFAELLGPHRLVHHEISSSEAVELLPEEMWWELIGVIVRMLPGHGPDSVCEDFGHAPASGIHRIYDEVMRDLDSLLVRSRSLLFIDWRYNREIHSVIRKVRKAAR